MGIMKWFSRGNYKEGKRHFKQRQPSAVNDCGIEEQKIEKQLFRRFAYPF